MKHMSRKNSQGGFIGVMIAVAIALGMAMMAWYANANKNSTGHTNDEQDKMNAALIVKEATDFRDGFALAMNDGISPSIITFDKAANTGLFQPTKGYASTQTTPIRAMDVTGTAANFVWNYNPSVNIKDIGADASPDQVVTLGEISLSVCQRINELLFHTDPAAVPLAGVGSLADYTTAPAPIDLTSSVLGRDGKSDLCVKTSDGKYVYYKVMVEN